MLSKEEKAYCSAMSALNAKEYATASVFFKDAEKQFAGNDDFSILFHTTDLLLAVKEEISTLEER
ncbi:MAG: hypothetical protein GY865_08120 [candidate division Zixibacteria bacterium]|nr:hypothetical protein [candidate division Zixibacteria bacterium]